MSHHKYHNTKNQRAGCLMCKPNKMNGFPTKKSLGHIGFSNIRKETHSEEDLKNALEHDDNTKA